MGILKQDFEFAAKYRDEAIATVMRLNKESGIRHLALLRNCRIEFARISPLLPVALIAAREELELSMDADAYAAIVEEAQQKTNARLELLFQQLEIVLETAAKRNDDKLCGEA